MNQKWAVGVILLAGIAGSVFIYQKTHRLQSASEVNFTGQLKSKGLGSAKVVIVGYSDFQCPSCQAAEPILTEFMAKYPKDIRLVFRHFPLPMHLWSSVAHQAAECAHRKGKFWEFHDKIFQTQKEWSTPANPTDRFLEFAKGLNLNLDQFAACLTDQSVTDAVKEDRYHGDRLKVESTPTFFINGDRVVGPVELKIKGEGLIRKFLGLPPLPAPALAPSTPVAVQTPTQASTPAANASSPQGTPSH
ncbi:MAG: hypothetical protein EXS63_03655 [Candidatus Omnitrophica bacterium]|nr:hypothetical protein [Candidatus Omnitrophota bacterium]